MFLVHALNKAVEEVPTLAKLIENGIKEAKWNEERTRYAIDIVSQLQKPGLVQNPNVLLKSYISFEPLKVKLSQSEVEKISKAKDTTEVRQYFEGIITDINKFSDDILLKYSGHDFSEDIWKIKINWYI